MEVTPPVTDPRMAIPMKPIPNSMPMAKVPAPPCPKEGAAVSELTKVAPVAPVDLNLMRKAQRPASLTDRYPLAPNPFRPVPEK